MSFSSIKYIITPVQIKRVPLWGLCNLIFPQPDTRAWETNYHSNSISYVITVPQWEITLRKNTNWLDYFYIREHNGCKQSNIVCTIEYPFRAFFFYSGLVRTSIYKYSTYNTEHVIIRPFRACTEKNSLCRSRTIANLPIDIKM